MPVPDTAMPDPLSEARAQILAQTSQRFADRGLAAPRLDVVFVAGMTHKWDAIYRRDGDGYVLELPAISAGATADKAGFLGHAYLYWLVQCGPEVERIGVTLSDGDLASAAIFSPSTNQPQMVPIPDPYFFINAGFSRHRALSYRAPRWQDRGDRIVWRGSSSGTGTFDPVLGRACPARATQRLKLCLAAPTIAWIDAGLSGYARDEMDASYLQAAGIVKGPIPEEFWLGQKFAIDVDGQTNTWSNFLVRLHFGCCVFKIGSSHGYRQWYYDRVRPFEHYIPVQSDLSDLAEQVDWARSHEREAAEIAARGQQFARGLTFEAGRREAVELLSTHWSRQRVAPAPAAIARSEI